METVTKAVAAMVKCCCWGKELGPCFLLGLPASFEMLCLGASIKGVTGWDGWMASLTQWTWVWASLWEILKDREARRAAVHGATKTQTWLSDWTTISKVIWQRKTVVWRISMFTPPTGEYRRICLELRLQCDPLVFKGISQFSDL